MIDTDNNNRLVSIIIPIYNVEKYLHECVESIKNQTHKDIEIILVDDGSPDNCPAMCDEYAKNDKRIKVIHKENGGLSDARNAGLSAATGEYIAFIDSDDWVDEDYVEKLINGAISTGADIVVCNYRMIYEDRQEELPARHKSGSRVLTSERALEELVLGLGTYNVLAWNKLYSKKLFTETGIIFPKGKINEDNYTTYKLYEASSSIAYIPDVLYNYRQRPGSIMSSLDGAKYIENIIEYSAEQTDYLKNKVPDSLLRDMTTMRDYSIVRQIDLKEIKNVDYIREKSIKRLKDDFGVIILSRHLSFMQKIKIFYVIMRNL